MSKVSVLLANYNGEKHLHEAIMQRKTEILLIR